MNYDHNITLIVPLDQLETAKRLSRALDQDVGGYEAFQGRATKDGAEYAIYSTPCTESFAAQAAYLIMVPEELHAVVQADYAARWPDFTCPTYEQVTEFCSLAECYVDDPQVLEIKHKESEMPV